jgi:NADPH2:quinone reductase
LAAGADAVLLHTDPTWVEAARGIAGGVGVHLAVDGIGGAMMAQTLGCVRPFGIVASLGQPAGPIPPVRVEDLGAARSIGLMRPSVIAYTGDPQLYRQGGAAPMAELQAGLVNPIGAEYALSDAAIAHADLGGRPHRGKPVLVAYRPMVVGPPSKRAARGSLTDGREPKALFIEHFELIRLGRGRIALKARQ